MFPEITFENLGGLIFHISSTSVTNLNYITSIAVKQKDGFRSVFLAKNKIHKCAMPFAIFSLFNEQG